MVRKHIGRRVIRAIARLRRWRIRRHITAIWIVTTARIWWKQTFHEFGLYEVPNLHINIISRYLPARSPPQA